MYEFFNSLELSLEKEPNWTRKTNNSYIPCELEERHLDTSAKKPGKWENFHEMWKDRWDRWIGRYSKEQNDTETAEKEKKKKRKPVKKSLFKKKGRKKKDITRDSNSFFFSFLLFYTILFSHSHRPLPIFFFFSFFERHLGIKKLNVESSVCVCERERGNVCHVLWSGRRELLSLFLSSPEKERKKEGEREREREREGGREGVLKNLPNSPFCYAMCQLWRDFFHHFSFSLPLVPSASFLFPHPAFLSLSLHPVVVGGTLLLNFFIFFSFRRRRKIQISLSLSLTHTASYEINGEEEEEEPNRHIELAKGNFLSFFSFLQIERKKERREKKNAFDSLSWYQFNHEKEKKKKNKICSFGKEEEEEIGTKEEGKVTSDWEKGKRLFFLFLFLSLPPSLSPISPLLPFLFLSSFFFLCTIFFTSFSAEKRKKKIWWAERREEDPRKNFSCGIRKRQRERAKDVCVCISYVATLERKKGP